MPPPPIVPQVSGSLAVPGLSAPVRIVRDRWGVPHIYAQRQDDLFFAQGFVQAQDRLFQMDLWRRSGQGRLSEVLGPNFIERDAMTRRIQYRGDPDADWVSYGDDTKAIATAFVRGINAWVALARERPPQEFALAGWTPDYWSPVDLLNRTEAFVASGDAIDEVRRLNLSDVIADAVRRVGTAPFFSGLMAPIRLKEDAGDNPARLATAATDNTVGRDNGRDDPPPLGRVPQPDQILVRSIGAVRITPGGPLTLSEARRKLEHPSPRYFVHLHAPGWNVIGATAPWRPGVAVGHNESIAWGMTATDADTQDIYAEKVNPSNGHQVQHLGRWVDTVVINDAIIVKGRSEPFVFESEVTPHGVIIASDRERHLVYTVRWSGTEPGAAAELAALALNRARTGSEFRAGLTRWKMPARRVVYAARDGTVGVQDAALVPVRRSGEWIRWMTIDELPHALNPSDGALPVKRADRVAPAPAPDRLAVFAHVLAITGAARRLFNVSPLVRPGDDAPVRAVLVPADWDRSNAINAPGQSESPASAHFSDLATLWESGESFPLAFGEAAVEASIESTLTLVPLRQP